MNAIDWKHYKHPLPEHVYDVYMKSWKNTAFCKKRAKSELARLISAIKCYKGRYGRIRLVASNKPKEKVLGLFYES